MPSFDISITNLYTSNASISFTGWPNSIKTYKFKVLKQTKNYLITFITNFGDIHISSDLCVISLQIQYSLIKLYVLFRPTKRHRNKIELNAEKMENISSCIQTENWSYCRSIYLLLNIICGSWNLHKGNHGTWYIWYVQNIFNCTVVFNK